jgi:hypothetical protein
MHWGTRRGLRFRRRREVSLRREVEAGAYEEWEREIQKRIAKVEAGTTKTIPWSDARERLMSYLRDGR